MDGQGKKQGKCIENFNPQERIPIKAKFWIFSGRKVWDLFFVVQQDIFSNIDVGLSLYTLLLLRGSFNSYVLQYLNIVPLSKFEVFYASGM